MEIRDHREAFQRFVEIQFEDVLTFHFHWLA